jgi:hypothetical protein
MGPRKELAQHAQLRIDTGTAVYFAEPRSPWQRDTNGLLRQDFPRGTDLSRWSAEEIGAVAAVLNSRPRKTLGWKPPRQDRWGGVHPCSGVLLLALFTGPFAVASPSPATTAGSFGPVAGGASVM